MSHFHTCQVRGERCEGRGLFNGEFLDYNTPPRTRDGRTACRPCADDTDRNGVEQTTAELNINAYIVLPEGGSKPSTAAAYLEDAPF